MGILKHLKEQPFIAATGLAALVHSTWALAILFGGEQPAFDGSSWPSLIASVARWAYWLIPPALIAITFDVGQVTTSHELRHGKRTKVKMATFIVFAVATYYLQLIYMVHHMPDLALAAGVRAEWEFLATLIRDLSVWVVPAFMPLATVMYTFSADGTPDVTKQTELVPVAPKPITVSEPARDALPEQTEQNYSDLFAGLGTINEVMIVTEQPEPATLPSTEPAKIRVTCECGWEGHYDTELSAKRAQSGHKASCVLARQTVYQNGANP